MDFDRRQGIKARKSTLNGETTEIKTDLAGRGQIEGFKITSLAVVELGIKRQLRLPA